MAESDPPSTRHELHDEEREQRLENVESVESAEREELRHQRTQMARVVRVVRFADFMAVLMVFATVFSAYATWRTANVTSLVFAISDRPFLGIKSVGFEATDSDHPTIAVNFQNFGRIPAINTLVSVHSLVDGKLIKTPDGEMSAIEAGIVSPTVPHYFYSYLPAEQYHAVAAGRSSLQVHVKMVYKGPEQGRQYCYSERIAYDYRSASFRLTGGSDRCGSEIY
jgi:hypothetical protein